MPVDRTTAYGPSLDLDIADRLLEIYTRTEQQLAADIARRLRAGMEAPDWAERKLAQAGALRRATLALLSRLAVDDGTIAQALVLAYMRGGQAAAAELLRLGQHVPATDADGALQGVLDATGAGAQRALASAVKAFPGLGALQRMVWSLASRLSGTHLPVLRWAIDSYRDIVAEGALAPVLLGTATRRAGTQRAWEQLLSKGITGFTDVLGRRWNLASYVEMATRTGVAQAAVEGHLDRLGDAGIDLVIVSNAPQECERCRPWEGKVLARGGRPGPRTVRVRSAVSDDLVEVHVAGTVAEAIAAGLMHPNCRHSLSAFLPGVTRIPTNTEDPEGDEARQQLRALERKVRKAKLQQAGALTPEAAKRAEEQIRAGQAAIRAHVKATRHLGIFRKPEREQVNLGHTTAPDAGKQEPKAKAPAAATPTPTDAALAHTRRLVAEGVVSSKRAEVSRSLDKQAALTPRTAARLAGVFLEGQDTAYADAYVRRFKQSALAAYSFTHNELHLHPDWRSDPDPLAATVHRCHSSGWYAHGPEDALDSVLSHEWGHHVSSAFVDYQGAMLDPWASRLLPALNEALGATRAGLGGRDLLTPIASGFVGNLGTPSVHPDLLDQWVANNRELLSERVSQYGASNFLELLAEIWLEYSTMGERARPHIRTIGRLMHDLAEEAPR